MDYYVITYDVRDDKRRTKINKLLRGYATPVQYSVFEGYLKREDFIVLRHKLSRELHERDDSICFYRQCGNCREQIERLGLSITIFGKDDIII